MLSLKSMLSRESILARTALKTVRVEVPEWGGHVFVKELSGHERDRWELLSYQAAKGTVQDVSARLLVFAICDAEGKTLFTEDDVPSLSALSGAALNRLWDAALKLNRIGEKDVEDIAGNCSASPSGSSVTDSL